MANLISVTSWSPLSLNNETPLSAAAVVLINPAKILSVKTRGTAYATTGVTDIVYEYPINQMHYQLTLIVTETRAAVLAAANAPLA